MDFHLHGDASTSRGNTTAQMISKSTIVTLNVKKIQLTLFNYPEMNSKQNGTEHKVEAIDLLQESPESKSRACEENWL